MKSNYVVKSSISIRWILIITSVLWMSSMLVACGSDKKNSENAAPAAAPAPTVSTQNLPRQNMIVRVNQTGQAEYAAVDFNPKANRRQLSSLAQNPRLQWAPVNSQAVINQQQGYPQAQDNNFYFVQEPNNFQGQNIQDSSEEQTMETNNIRVDLGNGYYPNTAYQTAYYDGAYNYGYHRYPYYNGAYYYGQYRYQHYYPRNPYAYYNSYNNFNYQPVYYSNYSYNYYVPCYYYNAPRYGYSYYYYSYWW
ncbi:MAG: hypothetical protein AB7F59_00545 [Bdellovibrionales bacterium]